MTAMGRGSGSTAARILAIRPCRVPGYTASVRPSASVMHRAKQRALAAYGLNGELGDYELDHFIPLITHPRYA
jgi:hypothetical protein